MTRKVRTHATGDSLPDSKLAPKHLTKQQFGKRLYRLMLAKGWNQSELARRAGLPRDLVSTYIRGASLPTPPSLKKVAEALGEKPEALLPNQLESAIDEDSPIFEMKISPNAPDVAWLRINRLVSTPIAIKVAEMLQSDDPLKLSADGKRSR